MAARKKVKGKLSGLNANGKPNAYWRRFKERLDTYSDTPLDQWDEEHLLGHILKRYRDVMDIDFSLSYSGPPTKCKEMYCIRRMMFILGTEDVKLSKEYIDFVFETYIIGKKVTIHSVAYFFTSEFILKFKAERRRKSKITRASKLPDNYQLIANTLELDVNTYGDLIFAKIAIDNDPDNEDYSQYKTLFVEMEKSGFKLNSLSSVEG